MKQKIETNLTYRKNNFYNKSQREGKLDANSNTLIKIVDTFATSSCWPYFGHSF